MGHEEKRSYFRRTLEEESRYFIEYKPKGKFFASKEVALTLNLSASGLLFRSAKVIPVNTILRVSMTLPHVKNPIRIIARVVRIDATPREGMVNIALHFTEISDSNRSVINTFCTEKKDVNPSPGSDNKPA